MIDQQGEQPLQGIDDQYVFTCCAGEFHGIPCVIFGRATMTDDNREYALIGFVRRAEIKDVKTYSRKESVKVGRPDVPGEAMPIWMLCKLEEVTNSTMLDQALNDIKTVDCSVCQGHSFPDPTHHAYCKVCQGTGTVQKSQYEMVTDAERVKLLEDEVMRLRPDLRAKYRKG